MADISKITLNGTDYNVKDANAVSSGDVATQISAATSGLQPTLVSGTNIKTINNESILGSGNITIQGGSGGGETVIELTQAQYLRPFLMKSILRGASHPVRYHNFS